MNHTLQSLLRPKKNALFITLIVGCLILISWIALSSFAKHTYWSDVHLQNITIDMSIYSDCLNEYNREDKELNAPIIEANLNAVPISPELELYFEECNDLIIAYFQDIYNVDVSQRLATMQIMGATYPSEASVGGSVFADVPELVGTVFINRNIIDISMAAIDANEAISVYNNDLNLLRTIYIHESMHYLGFSSEPEFDCFIEAIAEALHEKIINHSELNYDNATGYREIKDLGTQIIDTDK